MVAAAPQYDPVAREYEERIAPRFAGVAEAIAEALDVRPADAILDLGAGTGGLSRLILPRLGPDGRLALVDLSSAMLEVAREVLGAEPAGRARVEYTVADLTELPFPAKSFDQVVAQFTPVQDTDAGLGEAARVLRSGGRFTIAFWGPAYLELDLLNRVRERIGMDPAVPPDVEAVARRVAAAGFDDVALAERSFDATYADVDAYLTYRTAFGRPGTVDDDTWARYWDALEAELRAMAGPDGAIRLDWSVVLLGASRR
jgi:SAM-dependent methyltransferase